MSQHEYSVEEINFLVAKYQGGDSSIVESLLSCFNPLISKYVHILKGNYTIYSPDTIAFLSLFLSGKPKTSKNLEHVIYALRRLTTGWDEEDLFQQIVIFVLEILYKFKKQPNINFLGYLSQGLRWRLKDWVLYEMCLMDVANDQVDFIVETPWYENIKSDAEYCLYDHIEISKLDLQWVQNSQDPLFKDLSVYERNILYHHAHGLGVESIGNLLGKTKDTIHKQLKAILQNIRDNVAEDDDLFA
jgi:RNA polymerase sigma factor (sigma-70 family)